MKNENAFHWQTHPMVIFWLGLLTGAVVVGLMFFYKNMNPDDYSSAVLNSASRRGVVEQVAKPVLENVVKTSGKDTICFPIPTPDMTAFPIPTPDKTAFPIPTPDRR